MRALLLTLVAGLAACDETADRAVAADDGITDGGLDAIAGDATVVDAIAVDATTDPLNPGDVRYRLAWDTDGLDVAPDGTWSTVTDLGYRVTLVRGWLTSYQMSMVPCWLVEGTRAERSPLWILWSLVGGVAHAGHDDEPEPSRVSASRVEALAPLVGSAFGAARVPAMVYCKAHYVAARADDDTLDRPDAYAGERITVHLEATWAAPGGEPVPFTVRSALAAGKNLALVPTGGGEDDALRIDPSLGGVELTVYRRPAGWFDGIDFAAIDDEETLDRAVLLDLTEALRLEVRR